MDAQRSWKYEARLLEERDRALEALHRIESEEAEPQSVSAGDTVRGLKDMAEAAADMQEQETDFASATRLSDRIADLDAALVVLRDAPERFGRCDECGEEIDARRLEMVPWSPLCASCARLAEETRAR
jgi:RNA polymerase-binding transcription factor DksA